MEQLPKPEENNVIDFEKAGEAVRRTKPSKRRTSSDSTEIRSFEKTKRIKELERQLNEFQKKIEELEKIYEKLETDFNLALSEKDKDKRMERGSPILKERYKLTAEIAKFKGLVETTKYNLRKIKGEN